MTVVILEGLHFKYDTGSDRMSPLNIAIIETFYMTDLCPSQIYTPSVERIRCVANGFLVFVPVRFVLKNIIMKIF
jgi:hypothetical protein